MLRFVWRATKGYRLHPWDSPFLRWRMETYLGLHADKIGFRDFCRFTWQRRRDLERFLHWAERMDS